MIAKGILGRGFKGTAAYLLHDKGASTCERVAWTHTENLRSNSPERAWREMVWAATRAEALKQASGSKRTGRKAELPVYHLSLSWAKDEAPDREAMIAAARQALAALGLENHQTLIVCHRDEPQPHVHLLINRVNHETGVMNRLSRSKRKLSAWALEYEQAQGRIRCEQRLESNQALEQGLKPRHSDAVIRDAWEASDSGRAFQAALAAQGYTLARGNKRIVVVDPTGKAINPTRQLRGVKAADIAARLQDLDDAALPTVGAVQARQQEAERQARAQAQEKERAVGKEKAGVLREAFGGVAGQVEQAPAQTAEAASREDYHAQWEQAIGEAAIAKEQSREAREQFTQAAGAPEAGQAQDGTEDQGEPPLREDYNADWERQVIEAAIEQEEIARHTRERFDQAAQGSGEAGGGHGGDSARAHFREREGPSPANDNTGLSASERRALLQSRHFDEQIAQGRRHESARLAHFERLQGAYDTSVYRDELKALERKRFRMPWHKERMQELRLTIEDAATRHQQARESFINRQEQERTALMEGQAQERLELEHEIAALPEEVRVSEAERQARERLEQAAEERAAQRQAQRLRQGGD